MGLYRPISQLKTGGLTMIFKRIVVTLVVLVSLFSFLLVGCGQAGQPLTYSQLIAQAAKYNGQTVTLEAFYFSGFEISALSEALVPDTYAAGRVVPSGALIWIASGISQELYEQCYIQTVTPSGYPEHFGKLKVSGRFESGDQYGHLNAYRFKMAITQAERLDWSPPAAAPGPTTGSPDTYTQTTLTSSAPITATPPEVEISLAPIHAVTVAILKSNPPQIGVNLQGGLRDGGTTFSDLQISREGDTIRITVTVQRPREGVFPAIYTYFEKYVNLGSQFTVGQTYTLKVNDYTTSFTY
jgi:hypothetical protein